MPVIDLAFTLQGTTIPLDYGYALFSALCRVVPPLHGDRRVGVHPIRGLRLEPRRLTLVPQSRLRLRLPSEEIAPYLALAGSVLDLDGDRLRVGIPRVESLRPAANLAARVVTIGHLTEPGPFAASVRQQLAEMGVSAEPSFVPSPHPDHAGEPSRRVLRIKGKRIIGYALRLIGLTAAESLLIQERGLGSRRRMGCGIFIPMAPSSR
ncbi:MAG: type I-MYXAN CRISPR-associated protein Cas6/Cmx6, partial [Isosphaeraceae bacterium]|nr:type I-MYXAN CRISPR-associated protein Cas6/Cmx6 [Isosphaeraceae bacterium]